MSGFFDVPESHSWGCGTTPPGQLPNTFVNRMTYESVLLLDKEFSTTVGSSALCPVESLGSLTNGSDLDLERIWFTSPQKFLLREGWKETSSMKNLENKYMHTAC